MQRLSDEGETVSVCVKMPATLRDALDETIGPDGNRNRSEAARVMIERGLNGRAPKPKETS